MGEPVYRPLDVVAAMEAVGISEELVDKFDAATERVSAVSLEVMVEHMESAGLSQKQRRTVKQRLLDGTNVATPPPADKAAMSPVGTAPGVAHETAPLPLIPYSDLKDVTRLGGGAFGDIYKGTYHGGEVAIKKAGVFAADASSVEKERRLLGSIKAHPNLVHVLGVCVDAPDGAVRLVMELCSVGDLVSFLDSLPKFVLTVFHQASNGVGHLHDTPPGICHRDIRRANLLVAARDPLRICLADFGLSHVLEAGGPSSTVTEIGPVAWRAPETFSSVGGQQEVSVKTDVYMFGCFMLEVMTGREPLYWVSGGAMQAGLRCRDLTKSPLDLAVEAGKLDVSGVANDPGVRGTVDDVMALIRRCLSASPAERPNMAAVASALEGMREKATGAPPVEISQAYAAGYGQVPGTGVVAAVPPPSGGRGEAGAVAEEAAAEQKVASVALRANIEREVRAEMGAKKAAEEAAAKKSAEEAATRAPAEEEEKRRVSAAQRAEAARVETAGKEADAKVAPSPPILADSSILEFTDAATVTALQRVLTTEWLVAGVPKAPGTTFVTKLLYRGTMDGMNPAAFHAACDRQGPTLTLIRSTFGYTFGAYAGESWCSPDEPRPFEAHAFLFSVTGPHGNLTHFPARSDGVGSIWCHAARGPCFGVGDDDGIVLRNSAWFAGVKTDAFDKKSRCGIPAAFVDTLGKGDASLAEAGTFTPHEVEVWACVPLQTIPNSAILASVAPERFATFLRELSVWLSNRTYTLLYRGSRDGMTAAAFHGLCDDKGPTLVLVQCDKGWVFGGHAGTSSWKSPPSGSQTRGSLGAFLFSVTGPYTKAPARFPIKPEWEYDFALYHNAGCGPCFSEKGDLCVMGSSASPTARFDGRSHCAIGNCYEDVLGMGPQCLTGAPNFIPVEIEVFAVTPA